MRIQNTGGRIPREAEVDVIHQPGGGVDVRFLTMPDWHTRDQLKAAGFRWVPQRRAWHGLAGMLPVEVTRVAER